MVRWLVEGLGFTGKKQGNCSIGLLVKRRVMVHWLKEGLWFAG
jgi:hypothetical protein